MKKKDIEISVGVNDQDIAKAEKQLAELQQLEKKLAETKKMMTASTSNAGHNGFSSQIIQLEKDLATVQNSYIKQLNNLIKQGRINQNLLEKLPEGQMFPVPVQLNTNKGQHNYEMDGKVGQNIKKALKGKEIKTFSATNIASLLTGSFPNFEEEAKKLAVQIKATNIADPNNINKISALVKEWQKQAEGFYNLQNAQKRGTAAHKLLELANKKEIELDNLAPKDLLSLGQKYSEIQEGLFDSFAAYDSVSKSFKSGKKAHLNTDVIKVAQQLRQLLKDNGLEDIKDSEKPLGAILKINDEIVQVTGTFDALGSALGTLLDFKTSQQVDPKKIGIQLNVLKQLAEVNGIKVGGLKALHAPFKGGAFPGIYNVKTVSSDIVYDWIKDAYNVSTGAKQNNPKSIPRLLESVFDTYTFTASNGEERQSFKLNGVPLHELGKKFNKGQISLSEIMEEIKMLPPDQADTLVNAIWSTKDYSDLKNPKESNKFYRQGALWDALRKNVPSFYTNLLSASPLALAQNGVGVRDFQDEEGDWQQEVMVGGGRPSAWGKLYKTSNAEQKKEILEKLEYVLRANIENYAQEISTFLGKISELSTEDSTQAPFVKAVDKKLRDSSLYSLWTEGYDITNLSKDEQRQLERKKISELGSLKAKNNKGRLVGYVSSLGTATYEVDELEEKREENRLNAQTNGSYNPELEFLGFGDTPTDEEAEMAANRLARVLDLFPRINKLFAPLAQQLSQNTGKDIDAETLARSYLSSNDSWVYDRYLRSKEIYSNFKKENFQNEADPIGAEINWVLGEIQNFQTSEEESLYDTVTDILHAKDSNTTLFKSIFGKRVNGETGFLDQTIGRALIPSLGAKFGYLTDDELLTNLYSKEREADYNFGLLSQEEWEEQFGRHFKGEQKDWAIQQINDSDFDESLKSKAIAQIKKYSNRYKKEEGVYPDWEEIQAELDFSDDSFQVFLDNLDFEKVNEENERFNTENYSKYVDSVKQQIQFLGEIPKKLTDLLLEDLLKLLDKQLGSSKKGKPNAKTLNSINGIIDNIVKLGISPNEALGSERLQSVVNYRNAFDAIKKTNSTQSQPNVNALSSKITEELNSEFNTQSELNSAVNELVAEETSKVAQQAESSAVANIKQQVAKVKKKGTPVSPALGAGTKGIPDVHLASDTALSEEEKNRARKDMVILNDKQEVIGEVYKLLNRKAPQTNNGNKGVFNRIEEEVKAIHEDMKNLSEGAASGAKDTSSMFDFVVPEGVNVTTGSGTVGGKGAGGKGFLPLEYTELLREYYSLQKELFQLQQQQEVAIAKQEPTAGIEKRIADLKTLEDYVLKQKSAFEAGFSDNQLKAVNERTAKEEAKLKFSSDTYASEFGVNQQIKAEREYEQLLNQRLRIEKTIESTQRNISVSYSGQEKKALQNIITMSQQELNQIDEKLAKLNKSGLLREEEVKSIKNQYEIEKATMQAQAGSMHHGNRSIWDVMRFDMQRATQRIFDYGLAYKFLNSIPRSLNQIYSLTLQLDESLTNLRIVTGYNQKQGNDLITTYQKLGRELGATTQEVASSANEWLRQGYTAQEAGDLIDASMKLSKLGMIESSAATEYLTSALKGFKLEAEDAIDIVDKLTKTDMDAAVSAGGIAEALSRTATSAQLAGLSIDQTIGIVSTIGEVTQKSMQSVGESVKTLLSRYGNVKAGVFDRMDLEDGGEETENINDIEKVLGKLGISIRNSALEMRNINEVLDDLAEKWQSLDSVSKNAVATAFAGVRQRENFNVMMENYDRVKELTEESTNAAGTAETKYRAYLDSVNAALKNLTNAWENFTTKLKSSSFVKFGLKFLTTLIDNLDTVAKLVTAIGAAFLSAKMPKWLNGFFTNKIWNNGQLVGILGSLFGQGDRWIQRHNQKYDAYEKEMAEYQAGLRSTPPKRLRGGKLGNSRWDWSSGGKNKVDANTSAITNAVNDGTNVNKEGFDAILTEMRKRKRGSGRGGAATKSGGASGTWTNGTYQPANTKLHLTEDAQGNVVWADSNGVVTNRPVTEARRQEYFRAKQKEISGLQQKGGANATANMPSLGTRAASAVGTGLITGITSGLMAPDAGSGMFGSLFNDTGQTVQSDTVDQAVTGIATGSLSAVGSFFLGPVGAMLGQLGGDFIGQLTSFLRHQDELERKERVEEARKQLETLRQVQTSLDSYQELNTEDLWDAEDYAQAKEYVNELKIILKTNLDLQESFVEGLQKNVKGLENVDLEEAINLLINGTKEERDEIARQLQLAELSNQVKQQVAANEEIYYNRDELAIEGAGIKAATGGYLGKLRADVDLLGSVTAEYSDTGKALRALEKEGYIKLDASGGPGGFLQAIQFQGDTLEERYENAQNLLHSLKTMSGIEDDVLEAIETAVGAYSEIVTTAESGEDSVRELEIKKAYVEEGISDLTLFEQTQLGYEGIIYKIVAAMEAEGIEVRETSGAIKSEYLSAIESQIKSDSNLTKVLQKETQTYGELREEQEEFAKVREKLVQLALAGGLDLGADVLAHLASITNNQELYDYLDYLIEFASPQNKKILEAIAEALGYSTERLVGLTQNANPDNILQLAKALHITNDELERLEGILTNISLSDALLSPSEVREKFDTYLEFLQELTTGALSAENLEQIISSYPELLQVMGEGENALQEYLQNWLFGDTNIRDFLYENSLFTEQLNNSEFFAEFKEKYQSLIDELDLPENLRKSWENAKTFDDIAGLLISDIAKNAPALQEALKEYWNFDLTYQADTTLLDAVIEARTNELEEQIENLQEQQSALEKVNEEREKEINLIKAKQKLETAQQEKKMVYRAGVGFVYETDAEAIKEAQDELDELEIEKEKNELQQQIDRLTAEKDMLSDLPDKEELESLKNTYELWQQSIIDSNDQQVDIISRIHELYTKINSVNFTENGQLGSWQESLAEEKQSLLEQLKSEGSQTLETYKSLSASGLTGEELSTQIGVYNSKLSSFNKLLAEATDLGLTEEEVYNHVGVDEVKNLIAKGEIDEDKYPELKDTLFLGPVDERSWSGLEYNEVNGTDLSISQISDYMPTGTVKKKISDNKYWVKQGGTWWPVTKGVRGFIGVGTNFLRNINKNAISKIASGTQGVSSSTAALVNELGTEAIVTPSGTITALPSRTGVVPADITKNLWQLGEVSPKLIADLSSVIDRNRKFTSLISNTSNNEGFYIDNLSMQVYPVEGYDMDKFVAEIKSYAKLSQNIK